jgi:fumarate hydratase subunit alpha
MNSREITTGDIERVVKDLCIKANTVLRPDVLQALQEAHRKEKGAVAKKMLGVLLANAKIAEKDLIPICQDTGMTVVFMDMGEDVVLTGDSLIDAVNNGVETAYEEGNFRKSVVGDPVIRENTGTNTPAVLHVDIVEGDKVSVSVMPKGFGSENKSRMAMLNPTCTAEDIVDFCVESVKVAGPDACPPYILGIGVGGTMDQCALLAKRALLRPIDKANPKPHIARMERDIKEKVNKLEIGVMGLGGPATAVGVNIEETATHIAGCPVAVNISCHALRSASKVI